MSNEAIPAPSQRLHVGLNAQLLSSESGYRNAGVSQYIHWLMTMLPRVSPDVRFTAFGGAETPDYSGWEIRAAFMPGHSSMARVAWEQVALPRAVRRAGVDVLHSPVYAGPLLYGRPQIVTLHDLSFYLFPHLFPPARRRYLQRMTRATTRRADAVIAVSESTARDAIEILGLPSERVHVIPNGVNPELHPPSDDDIVALRTRYDLPERYVLYLGTLEPRKNLPTLIKAYGLARRSGIQHGLVIAGGKGWYDEPIYEAVRIAGLEEDVRLTGYVPSEHLAALYGAADLFVYPSLYEGFGLPPLEAMACGTPVLVSNVSAMPEVMGKAGVTVNPRESKEIAEAMLSLLADEERRRTLAKAGLERAARYSWENTARLTAALYREVAA
ncbi:MAG: glycosyltransferase family 4 protein [Anaerolineae bacterium]